MTQELQALRDKYALYAADHVGSVTGRIYDKFVDELDELLSPPSGVIPVGTKVRLRTTNGGDGTFWLDGEYRSCGGYFVHHESQIGRDRNFYVEVDRIVSVEPTP